MIEGSDRCSTCKNGYIKPTGEVVIEGGSMGEFKEISNRRVYQCDNCKKRLIKMGLNEYVELTADVKTEFETK